MKILILHKSMVLGGTEKVLLNYLNILAKNHHITLLLTHDLAEQAFFQEGIPNDISVYSVFNQNDIRRYSHISTQRRKSLWHKIRHEAFKGYEQWRYYHALRRLITQKNIDLIIDFSGCLDKFIRLPSILRYGLPPTLRWVHGRLQSQNEHEPDAATRLKFHRILTRHSGVVGICPEMSLRIQHMFNLPADKIHTQPNPIDLNEIEQKAAQTLPETVQQLRPYILQTARLDTGKGHEELIEIYAKIKQRGITHKLCFLGEGNNRAVLEAKIHALGLQNDCLLLGAHRNPYPFFKHADLFVHTSEHEGLPTVLLESMACGTPVVAMDCPTGPKDILGADSRYGRLIPMHNQDAFADAVVELLTNRTQHQHYAEQGKQRAADFSADNIGAQLETLLQKFIIY